MFGSDERSCTSFGIIGEVALGQDRLGRDAVRSNSGGTGLRGDILRQQLEARLRRGIRDRAAWVRATSGGRRHRDDVAATALLHARQEALDRQERRGEVRVDRRVPLVLRTGPRRVPGAPDCHRRWRRRCRSGRTAPRRCRRICSMSSNLVTSAGTAIASPPAASISLHTASIAALSRPFTATRAPSRANRTAIAAPMPRELPVTTATRSRNAVMLRGAGSAGDEAVLESRRSATRRRAVRRRPTTSRHVLQISGHGIPLPRWHWPPVVRAGFARSTAPRR